MSAENVLNRPTTPSVQANARLQERDENIPHGLELPVFLSLREILNLTGWGRSKLYREIRHGRFPPPNFAGGTNIWPAEAYQQWAERLPINTALVGDEHGEEAA